MRLVFVSEFLLLLFLLAWAFFSGSCECYKKSETSGHTLSKEVAFTRKGGHRVTQIDSVETFSGDLHIGQWRPSVAEKASRCPGPFGRLNKQSCAAFVFPGKFHPFKVHSAPKRNDSKG